MSFRRRSRPSTGPTGSDGIGVAELRAGVVAALAGGEVVAEPRPVRLLSAGFSSVVLSAGRHAVVRVDRDAGAAERSRRTGRLLTALATEDRAGRIPRVLAVLPRDDLLPYGATVLNRLPGRTLNRFTAWTGGPELASLTASFLRRLHHHGEPAYRTAGIDPAGTPELELVERVVPRLAEQLTAEEFGRLSDWRDRYLDWFPTAPRRTVHGDLWHGNLLTRDGCPSGVLDWEHARFAPAATDLCGLWYLGAGFGRRLLAHYARGLRFPPSVDEVRLCRVARELEGVDRSLSRPDPVELPVGLAKLRAALAIAGR